VANDDSIVIATKFHCIKCGNTWGDGESIGSSGICPGCFREWAKQKKLCFGTECLPDKEHCSFRKFCKEYYGIKRDLLW
jgi:hypothetical protein